MSTKGRENSAFTSTDKITTSLPCLPSPAMNVAEINIVFVSLGISQSLGNFQGRWCQECCSTMRQNMVTNLAFTGKIYQSFKGDQSFFNLVKI